jgi:hypothetical protein
VRRLPLVQRSGSPSLLARRSFLEHPQVGRIELPLLVPAFSSKGFGFRTAARGPSKRIYSDIAYDLESFGRQPSAAVLVSAYDLFFGHFDAPKLHAKPKDYLRNSTVVFLDSGGYELISHFDSTEARIFPYTARPGYGLAQYEAILEDLTTHKSALPLAIANFDYGMTGKPLRKQISTARTLFNKYPHCLSDLIIKPWQPRGTVVEPSDLSRSDLRELRGFHIIGVTEKDLGRDTFDRLRRVAELRYRLTDAGITAPIHVWGGLDPLLSPLFFFAGAEILDGVSWMRYAYQNGVAMERQSSAILKEIGVTASQQFMHACAALDNLTFLNGLTIALQQWVDFDGNDFNMFHTEVKQKLQVAYIAMKTRIKELGESK